MARKHQADIQEIPLLFGDIKLLDFCRLFKSKAKDLLDFVVTTRVF